MDFFRDIAIAIIIAAKSAVIAITAIFVSIRVAKQKKSLSYKIISSYPLLKVDSEIKDRLKILLDKKPVEDINMIVFQIINDGDISIRVSDFENPLTINFDEKLKIISAEILETKPPNISPVFSVEVNSIKIEPLLLNQNDFISIKVLCTGHSKDNIQVLSRIEGVKEIKYLKESKPVIQTLSVGLSLVSLLGDFSAIILLFQTRLSPVTTLSLSPFITALLIFLSLNAALSISTLIVVFVTKLRKKK